MGAATARSGFAVEGGNAGIAFGLFIVAMSLKGCLLVGGAWDVGKYGERVK